MFNACSKVPITGRKQMNMLPESELITIASTNYAQFLSEHEKLTDVRAVRIRKVGMKISAAVTAYMKKHGLSKRIKGYNWEFSLVEDELVNAWCMPGGKVVFYTGILPITLNDTGIAVVMGHEIAHAIARHGNERMSQSLVIQTGAATLGAATSQESAKTQNLFNQSYGLASTLGMLKYSRKHETEADKMGLAFMAMAGYKPEAAIGFWERMSAGSAGAPPELLSTHPHGETRIKEIKEYLPEAMKYFKE